MRLPSYSLCERGNTGSSPPGLREASPLVVINQPAPIAPHLSGPGEDSSSDSVSSESHVQSRKRAVGSPWAGQEACTIQQHADSALEEAGLAFLQGY